MFLRTVALFSSLAVISACGGIPFTSRDAGTDTPDSSPVTPDASDRRDAQEVPSRDGGSGNPTSFDHLRGTIEAERVSLGVPGMAVAIVLDGKLAWAEGFGSRLPGKDDPVLPTTLFRIGSVTKMMTATAVLQDVEAGKARLDVPVVQYVPGFHLAMDPDGAKTVLLRHLLAHTSGLIGYLEVDVPAAQKEDGALEAFFTSDTFYPSFGFVMSPAGRLYNYSNPNYMLAGLVLEKLGGKPYRQIMKERVFTPLKMDRTFFLPSEVLADGDYARATTTDEQGNPREVGPDSYDNGWARPAGYAFSSVLDLARFAIFLMDGNQDVLGDALRQQMQTPEVNTWELLDLHSYGLGLEIDDGVFLGGAGFHKVRVVRHEGGLDGYITMMYTIPSARFAFLSVGSSDSALLSDSLVEAIVDFVSLAEPDPKPVLADTQADLANYAGKYEDPWSFGVMDVTLDGGKLSVSIPDLDAYGVSYDPVLQPASKRNFVFMYMGIPYPLTFIPDADGKPEFMRTLISVAERVDGK